MARRANTSTGDARSNVSDSSATNAGDSGSDNTGASNAQGTGDVSAPAKRRKRGPNKPKPGTFLVETSARMGQEEIIKLLTAHATAQLGADVAGSMELQVSVDGACLTLENALPDGGVLQFGTVAKTAG